MQELETRILDINVEYIKRKMVDLGGYKVKDEDQINKIFDFTDRRLLSEKGYARVRTVSDKLNNKIVYFMTTKKMLSQEKYKIMEENEIIVDDGDTAEKLFLSLGLTLVETIKKSRESYKYKNTLVEIDINDKSYCPFPYIEIETAYENELKEVVEALGYSMEDTTSKTIYEILEERGLSKGTQKGL
ncbi:CYTH domain-containing protein [Clostridium sp. C8-1-8]|uniref:class IV adenylate cyclase n=1 Tax=Clostridium sp. C8-1-8 TaxID=2698831 RepID=UPI0013714E23|nr:CYTH domain-containing protein [Clostridium sp. C8-1-8]